jgi:hypothetical protein
MVVGSHVNPLLFAFYLLVLYAMTGLNAEEIIRQLRAARGAGSEPPRPYGSLSDGELFWRDHQQWLETQGYRLRPRYRPDWVPTWTSGKVSIWSAEDSPRLKVCHG